MTSNLKMCDDDCLYNSLFYYLKTFADIGVFIYDQNFPDNTFFSKTISPNWGKSGNPAKSVINPNKFLMRKMSQRKFAGTIPGTTL